MDDEDRLGLAPREYGWASAVPTLPHPVEQDDFRDHHSHKYSKKNWNQQLQQPGSGAQPPSQTLSSALFDISIHPQSDLVEVPRLLHLDPSQSHQQQAHQQHQDQNRNEQRLVRPSPPPFQHVNLPASHPHSHPHLHVHSIQPPQPNHRPSQGPQLPPLAASLSSFSISPFDPFHTHEGGTHFLSSTISPAPAPPDATLSSVPRLPAQADDIVSPISETRSSTPVLCSSDRRNERIAHPPTALPCTWLTPPSLRRQPTSDSLAGASLLDDKDFELSLGVTGGPERSATSGSRFASAAVISVVAHDAAHLTTDERSDDWFKFTVPESTISRYTNSHSEPHKIMTVAMAADRSSVLEQQQQSGQITTSTSSFTPLPPIRRTSTFDLLRKKGLVDDDSDTAPSPIEKDVPPAVSPVHADAAQQTSNGQLSAGHSASHSSPHSSAQPPPSQQNWNVHGQSQSPMPQYPNGLVATGPPGQTGTSQQHQAVAQMYPPQMIMGRNGPAGQQVAPGQMMMNSQGRIITSGGRQWIVQESHLIEPLNPSNRNRSANSLQSYSAYDKETEGEYGPPPQAGPASSQLIQTRPRNASNTPPTTAMRYPALFPPTSSVEQHPLHRQQGQVPLSQHPLQRSQISNVGARDSFDGSSKEMGVRVDQVSVSSIASEEVNDNNGRGLGSLFSSVHRRSSSSATTLQQGSSDEQPERKKPFFSSVTGISNPQRKPTSNLGLTKTSTLNESDNASPRHPGDNVPGRKRLSELKGMIKGVGHAKEGAKDDQPVKVETIYEARQSLQGPPRNNPSLVGIQGAQRQAGPFGPQAQPGQFGPQGQPNPYGPKPPMQPHPSQMGQSVAMIPAPVNGTGRAGTPSPQPGHIHHEKSEETGKKSSAGGFLGGLFNKQANKTKEVKSHSPQQRPPSSQRPMQPPSMQSSHLPFSHGQMHHPGQQLGPHPMLAGQPQFPRGPPGQSPSSTLFQDPTQPPPSLQTAQVVTIRRPSEITVSTQGTQPSSSQRPNMPSPQGSQGTFRQHPASSPLGQRTSQTGPQNDGTIAASQTSPQLSDKASHEKLTTGAPSTMNRISPNRKPVGSASFKGDGPFMTSAMSPAAVRPEGRTVSPSPRPSEQQRVPMQLSQAQQSPQQSSFGVSKDMRQPSLPTPIPSPITSQSNHSSSPRLQGGQSAHDSPELRGPEQGLGVFPNGLGQSGPMNASGSAGASNGLKWGPNGFRPAPPSLAPPSATAQMQPTPAPSSPVPSMDQSKLAKFFGAYDGAKPAAQPQGNKEKSAASKFLGAFKRSSKHNEASQPQQRPQTSPQLPQNVLRPGVPNSGASGAIPNPGVMSGFSGAPMGKSPGQVHPGQDRGRVSLQVAEEQTQAGRGQAGQIPSYVIPIPGQAGRGQNPPGMIPGGGRGQPPPRFPGTGPLPPQMQYPATLGQRGNEPRYDQVPIPRGYEAVHGYGPGGMLAPSPYNAGRPGLPPVQYAQFPPTMQPGFGPQQWDPRIMQPPQVRLPLGAAPSNIQTIPQGLPNGIPRQSPPQHPQLQGPAQNVFPKAQNFQTSPGQNQVPPQQFTQSQPAQDPTQLSPPGQGHMPTQGAQSVQLQHSQSHRQESQQVSNAAAQAQSPVNWNGTPEKTHSPASVRQLNPPVSSSVPQNSVQNIPVSGSPASIGTPLPPSQHIAATAPSQPPQPVQANPMRQTPPANQVVNGPASVQVVLSQGQSEGTKAATQNPISTVTTGGFLRSPDATRLTSRMSVSRQGVRNASPSVENLADRAMSVSPEPPGARQFPIHQVSEQNLSVNIERANNHTREGSEDIYDATPRLVNSKFQGEDQAHENTKYAGSEKSRVVTNGATVVGAAAGTGASSGAVTEDNMSFLDGPDDSETDDNQAAEESKEDQAVSPPQRTATMNMEPEEKILVDEPVELAAVHDDDDGIPMMTATSYPGQEWNPYGAGEFGDWE